MSTEDENSADMEVRELRADAIDCVERLLKHLQADQTDLLQWRQRRHRTTLETEPGLSALVKVIEATVRVRAELQDG